MKRQKADILSVEKLLGMDFISRHISVLINGEIKMWRICY